MTAAARSSPMSRASAAGVSPTSASTLRNSRANRRIGGPDAAARVRPALRDKRSGRHGAASAQRSCGRQLGEALHRRPFEALSDHLIEREQAALARPGAIGEGDRRRIERGRLRRVGGAGRAVTGRAMLRVERLRRAPDPGSRRARAAPDKRRAGRRPRPRAMRAISGGGARLPTAVSSAREASTSAGRCGPRRQARRRRCATDAAELAHLVIFELADDAPVLDRARIVDRDVIEQPPGGLDRGVARLRERRGAGERAAAEPEQSRNGLKRRTSMGLPGGARAMA